MVISNNYLIYFTNKYIIV